MPRYNKYQWSKAHPKEPGYWWIKDISLDASLGEGFSNKIVLLKWGIGDKGFV